MKYHSCSPLDNLYEAEYRLKLHSCQGFLMVSAFQTKSSSGSHQIHWFCDLLTGRGVNFRHWQGTKEDDVMCDLQRNIIPRPQTSSKLDFVRPGLVPNMYGTLNHTITRTSLGSVVVWKQGQ